MGFLVRILVCSALALISMPAVAQSPIAAGPMSGRANHHDAMIWVRTRAAGAVVHVAYWPAHTKADVRKTSGHKAEMGDGHIAHIELTELSPGTTYEYAVSVNGQPVKVAHPLRFQTQPIVGRNVGTMEFTVAAGSCVYINDPQYDDPEKPYGGGYGIFDTIIQQSPTLMLWLGDNIYLRPTDWNSKSGIYRRYARDRSLPRLQALLGGTQNYAIWDDHDFGPNNSDRSYVHKAAALEAFKSNWANNSYGLPDVPGVFGHFTWGDVEFFLIDNRYHRSPSNAPRTPEKTLLGNEQFEWLIDALTSSRAPFKVVVSGGQVLSPFDFFEGYAQFPHEQQRLLNAIIERKISGVLFLSGDRHHTELVKIHPDGFYPLYDFTTSPLTSRGAGAEREWKSASRVPGTLVTSKRNFALLHFRGKRGDRSVTLETRDAEGKLLWTHTIRASELTVKVP